MARICQAVPWIRWFACGVLFLGLVSQGMSSSFVFRNLPTRPVQAIPSAENVVLDCTTNRINVTTKLLRLRINQWVTLPSPLFTKVHFVKKNDVFTIINFSLPNAGQYKCQATDTVTKQTIEWPGAGVFLIYDHMTLPKVYVTPKTVVILLQGESFNFTCKSVKATTLTWFKMALDGQNDQQVPDNKVITIEDNTDKFALLAIKNAQKSDTGHYKCVMSFRTKSNHQMAALRVMEHTPPQIVSHSSTITSTNLQDVSVQCTVTGYPEPAIKWYKGNKEIIIPGCKDYFDKSDDIFIECKGSKHTTEKRLLIKYQRYRSTLKISQAIYPDDHGMYYCKAVENNSTAEANITVNIQVAPKIDKRTNTAVLAVKNHPAKMVCSLEMGNPEPTWTWEFQKRICLSRQNDDDCDPSPTDWIPLTKSHKVEPAPGTRALKSTVNVPKEQGQSFYRCKATNKFGSDNFTVSLLRTDVYEIVSIVDSKVALTYTAGMRPIEIECDIYKQFSPFGVHWYRGSKLIYPGSDDRIVVNTANSTLDSYDRFVFTITNTTVEDSGIYTCSIVTDRNRNATRRVTIKARVEPNITSLVSQDVKEEKNIVELRCDTSHANPPPTVTWFKNNEEIAISNDRLDGANLKESCKSRTSGYYYLLGQVGSPLIICKPKHPKFTGKYMCTAENIEGRDSQEAQINILAAAKITSPNPSKKIIEADLGSPLNITCTASGNPVPTVVWTRTGQTEVLQSGKGSARLRFIELLEKNLGNYTCNATNYKSSARYFSIVENKADISGQTGEDKGISKQALIGIIVGCVAFVLLVSIICFVVYRRQKKQIEEYKELYFLRTGNSDYKIDPDRSLLDQCNDLPYDLDWEFPEERLILGKPLGAGAFGQVVKAEAIGMAAFKPRDKTPDAVKNRSKLRRSMRESKKKNEYASMRISKTTVAVKTLKEGATQNDYKDLASELKILIHLGNHKNIVNVLGACTRGRRLMVIIEFAPHGDLLSFLRARRDIYEPNWVKTSNNPEQEFTLVDIAMAAYQISRGMEFLASRKCVHRDLAARNVLVGKDFVMKISDFGLARDIYKDDLYVKTTSGLLPVKWMAMESLFDRVYTEKSDVWSFGIVLWEIFTLGGNPYPGLPTEQLLDYLSEGQRMKQPQNCPLEMYAIMRDCWMQFPEQRPEFMTIAERLGKILERNVSEDNPYIYLEMDEQTGTTDYYLNPCDAFNTQGRQTVDGYEEALPTPRPDTSNKYDSPLPGLPPDSPGYDGPSGPLPSIPPTYEEATQKLMQDEARKPSQSSNESGIGFDDKEKEKEENEPLIVHLEDETRFSPNRKGKSSQESSV